MPEVTVRDARPDDAAAIAQVWAGTLPLLVRSAARVPADMAEDAALGRRRWVGLLDGVVVATATARRTGEREVYLAVEVHPDSGSRGVGTALLREAVGAFADATDLVAVCTDDPISLAFSVRNGFLPDGEHRVSSVVPATVPPAGPAPTGYTPVTLDQLPDLDGLLATHNTAALGRPERAQPRLHDGHLPGRLVAQPRQRPRAVLRPAGRLRRRPGGGVVHQHPGRPRRGAGPGRR